MGSRIFRLCIACCVATSLVACGPDDENNGNTNNDTTNNVTNNQTTPDTNNNSQTNNNPQTNNNNPQTNNNGEAQCTEANQDCVEGEETNAGFLCVDSKCRTECDETVTNSCLAGQVCLPVSQGGPSYCQPSQCAGYLDFEGCDAGLKCVAAVNDAAICIPEGAGALGDACEEFGACGGGLICAFGACNTICDADSDCNEAGGERCILDTLDDGVGFCSVGCDSYSTGQCPDGQGCFPVTADDGVCDAVGGTAAPYESCSEMVGCGENTACITFQGANAAAGIPAVSRCLPFCNAAADTEAGRNSTCMSAGGEEAGFGRFVHLDENSGALDIYVDDALVVDDLAFGATSAGFASLSVGAHKVDVVDGAAADNSAPLVTVNPTIAANDALTWAITTDALADLAVVDVTVPRGEAAPAAGTAKIRAAHAIGDLGNNADVVAIPAGELTFANEIEIATNIAYGEAGAFVEVPAANYDVYVFPAGATRLVTNVGGGTITGVAVTAGDTLTAWAGGTLAAGDAADPSLTMVAYASAPASSGDGLDGFCLDLSQDGVPSPQSGFCLENCGSSDVFGTNVCSGPSDYCAALGVGPVCFPGGPNDAGEACNPANVLEGCNGTGYCEGRGDGTGLCRAYCQPTTQSNPRLGCEAIESCIDVGNNLGLCAQDCTPTNFADTSCPAGLQTCIPQDGASYCAASGDTAIGGACDVQAAGCVPGASCVNDFAQGNLNAEDPFVAGACAATCDPFGDGTECGAGQVCAINWLTLNPAAGHCMTPDETLAQDAACAAEYNVCGQSSFCLDVGNGAQCLQMCDLDDATTCSSGTCTELFQSADIRIGACI